MWLFCVIAFTHSFTTTFVQYYIWTTILQMIQNSVTSFLVENISKKGPDPIIKCKSEEDKIEGVMFVFTFEDGESSSFMCYDSMFDGINGYQNSNDFITENMLSKMINQLKIEEGEEFYGSEFPLNKEDMDMLLFEYSSLMFSCEGGENPSALYFCSVF